jgi:hypothetical protein
MRTNVINLSNRVSDYDCPTFLVLHRTKCKPMHSEWERSPTIDVLHKTKRESEREKGRVREREREREASEGVSADSTVHPLVTYLYILLSSYIYINISDL